MRNGSPYYRLLMIVLIVMLIFGLLLLAAGIYLDGVTVREPGRVYRMLTEGRMMA